MRHAIEQGGIGGAEKGGGGAGGIELIAHGQVVLLALFATSFGPNGRAGIDKIFKRTIGADNGADIAPFHDEWGKEPKPALKMNEVFA